MIRTTFATLMVLAALGSQARATAPLPVQGPGRVLVWIPTETCEKPDMRVWENTCGLLGLGWRPLGLPVQAWTVAVRPSDAVARKVPTSTLRGAARTAAGSVGGSTAEITAALRTLPLQVDEAQSTMLGDIAEVTSAWQPLERLTVDGTPAVALTTHATPGFVATAAATAVLTAICGNEDGQPAVLPVPAGRIDWRVMYRHPDTGTEAAKDATVASLEKGVAASRGDGHSVGVHREKGGVIFGLKSDAGSHILPPREGRTAPGTALLTQRASRKAWHPPLQGVFRLETAPENVASAAAFASQVVATAQAGAGVLGVIQRGGWYIEPNRERLEKSGLSFADVDFALRGITLGTPVGGQLRLVLEGAQKNPKKLSLVSPEGRKVALKKLGRLKRGVHFDALDGGNGMRQLYVGVPRGQIWEVAKAATRHELPAGIERTQSHWKVIPSAEKARILDWVQGR